MANKSNYDEEVKNLEAIKAIQGTLGVKVLLENLSKSINSSLDTLISNYHNVTEMELRSLCANLRADLEVYKAITGVDKKIDMVKTFINEELNP